jgi:hypothetical protein
MIQIAFVILWIATLAWYYKENFFKCAAYAIGSMIAGMAASLVIGTIIAVAGAIAWFLIIGYLNMGNGLIHFN